MSDSKEVKDLLEKIETKVEKLDSRLDNIDVTLGKQQVSLDDHIKRTALLEAQVAPLQKDMNMIHGGLKAFGVLCAVITGAAALVEVLTYLHIFLHK